MSGIYRDRSILSLIWETVSVVAVAVAVVVMLVVLMLLLWGGCVAVVHRVDTW